MIRRFTLASDNSPKSQSVNFEYGNDTVTVGSTEQYTVQTGAISWGAITQSNATGSTTAGIVGTIVSGDTTIVLETSGFIIGDDVQVSLLYL